MKSHLPERIGKRRRRDTASSQFHKHQPLTDQIQLVALNRRLREISPLPRAEILPRRTVGQLLEEAEARRKREQRRRAQEAEARRVRDLEALARREAETWAEAESLIGQMQSKPYDEAVALLVKLRDLAQYRGEEGAFQARINNLHQRYSRRSGLIRRLRDAGLYEL